MFTVKVILLGQTAAKLLSIKLWEWFDPRQTQIWADWFKWGKGWAADFFLRPPTLTASNFAALWPTDPKFLAIKDLNLFKKCIKNQEASSILKVVFAFSKWPHLHRELSNCPGMVVRHCNCKRFSCLFNTMWNIFAQYKYTMKKIVDQSEVFWTKVLSLDFKYETYSNNDSNSLIIKIISIFHKFITLVLKSSNLSMIFFFIVYHVDGIPIWIPL